MLPHSKAEVSERDWLMVGDEESFASGGSRRHEVFSSKDMRVGDVAHIGDIP